MIDAFEAQVLEIDDAPASEVSSSDTFEPSAPIETQTEEIAADTPPEPGQTDETLTQPQSPAKAQQSDKTQQPAQDGTPEHAQETIAAKASELDRADAAFTSGDYAGMAETFESMFGENPAACADALWMGLRFLEQRAPEHLSNFSRMVVSDELGQQGIWNVLELIHESAQKAGAQETLALLDQLAGGLQHRYGLGPATPETQAAEWSNYTRHVGAVMEKSVDADIARAFGPQFSAALPGDQQELIKAARFAVRDDLEKDRKLGAALQELNKSYSVKEGVKVYFEVIEPRVRALVSRVVQNLAGRYNDLFKKPAIQTKPQPAPKPVQPAPKLPISHAERMSKNMSMADLLKQMRDEEGLMDEPALTQDEANGLSDQDILNSSRPSQQRKPWRPEDVFA